MAGGRIDILVEPELRGFASKLGVGLRASSGVAAAAGRAIGVAITAGAVAAAAGLKQVVDLGVQYQNSLNTLQAVTGATAGEMERVGAAAKALGSDLTLPATSAVDAAAAMTELAKGGLSVDEAMTAARGTLQLAAAAQIDAARAATIQVNALNAFSLSADQAGHVADVLANAANASSGEITDFADAFQQGGAVAAQFGITVDDTATALALLANRGIQGSDAGTLLKSALLALTRDTKPARESINELGLTVFDAKGNFVGLESILDQLRGASKRMTQEQYAQATATLFGSDAARLAGVAATSTAGSWDELAASISKTGGASDVAAAKTKGVGGAIEGLKSQLETAALTLFDTFDQPLEAGIRAVSQFVSDAGAKLEELAQPGKLQEFLQDGIDKAVEFAESLGINVGAVVDFVKDRAEDVRTVGANIAAGLRPVASGVENLLKSFGNKGGVIATAATGLGLFSTAVARASDVLGPAGKALGKILDIVAELPEPVKAAGLAFLTFKGVPALADKMGTSIGGLLGFAGPLGDAVGGAIDKVIAGLGKAGDTAKASTGGMRQFTGEMRAQRQLAEQSGQGISRYSAAQAAFETSTLKSVSALRRYRDTFTDIKTGADAAGTPVSNLAAGIAAFAEQNDTVAALKDSFDGASGAVASFGGSVERSATRAANSLSDRLVGATNNAAAAMRSLPGKVAGIGPAIANTVKAAVQVVVDVPGKVATAGAAMKQNLVEAADGAGESFSKVESFLKDNADKIEQGLRNVGPRALSAFRSIGSAVAGGLSSATAAVGRFGSSVAAGFRAAGAAVLGFPRTLAGVAGSVGGALRGVPGAIRGALGSATTGIAGFGRAIQTGIVGAFRGIPTVVGAGVGALSRFASTAAGIGATLGTGLLRSAGSLVGFLGGPWGVALAAAGIGLQVLAKRQQEAAQKAAVYKAAVSGITESLKATSGVLGQSAREQLVSTDAFKTAAEGAKQYGLGLDELANAAIKGGPALDNYRAKLQGIIDTNTFQFADADGSIQTGLTDTGLAAQKALADFDALTGVVKDGKQSYADYAEAVDKAGGSMVNGASNGATLQAALTTLGDAAASADDKTRALNDALNVLSGGQLSLEAANAKLNESLSGIGESFTAAATGAQEAKTSLLDASGAINTTTESGRALFKDTQDLTLSMADTAQAAFDAAGGFGNLGPATDAAQQAAQRAHDAFIQAATSAGLNAEQAEALATRYGLIPANVTTLLTAQGLDQTAQDLLLLKARFDQVPGEKTVTVQALSEEAQTKLRDLGFTVTTLPDGQVQVTAPTDQAIAQLDSFIAFAGTQLAIVKLDADPSGAEGAVIATVDLGNGQTATMRYNANAAEADGTVRGTVDLGNNQTATMTYNANRRNADGTITATVDYGNNQTATIKLGANAGGAQGVIDGFIRRNDGRTIRIFTSVTGSGGMASAGRLAAGGIVQPMHDGGMIRGAVGFAKGGHARSRKLTPMPGGVASIVAPNTWRIVGDRLRDDEAYIPINGSQRSQHIFEETARRMRYAVTRLYADGGIAGGMASPIRDFAARSAATTAAVDNAAVVVAVQRVEAALRATGQLAHQDAGAGTAAVRSGLAALANGRPSAAASAQAARTNSVLGAF